MPNTASPLSKKEGDDTATVWQVEALRQELRHSNEKNQINDERMDSKLDSIIASNKKYGEDLEQIIDKRIEAHIGLTRTQQKANLLIIISSTAINIILTLVNLNIKK